MRFEWFPLVLFAVACSRVAAPVPQSGASAEHRGTLRVALAQQINTLDPILSTLQPEAVIDALVMDPLVALDPSGRDVPVLAATVPTLENGGISRDGLTITYHLRHGVKWQDGAPFTSADVAFTVAAIMNPHTNVSTRHGYDDIARVDTPDPHTAIFHLKHRFAPAVDTFFATSDAPLMILPKHLLGAYADLNQVPFNAHPIGTGPFRVVSWERGDHIELAANDGYFLGKPQLQRIVIHFVPDETTVVNQLRSNEVDWFVEPTPTVYQELKTIPGLRLALVPINSSDSIIFNTTAPPVDDARVRRAIGLAIDKHKLADEATYGSALPATEDLPSFLWAYDPHAGTSTRDLAQANALLDAAGWKRGPDGLRYKNGKPLRFDLDYRTEAASDRRRGVIVVAMLRDAGIDARLKGYTTSLLYAPTAMGGILNSGHYQASFQTWYAGADPDDSTQLMCDQRPPAGYNWSRYCDPEMDAAERTALSHYDRATRKRAYARTQMLLARDAPFVYLWWQRQIEPTSPRFHGFRPNGLVDTWNAYQWSVE